MEYYREKSVGDGGRNWREEECRWGTGGRCWGSTSCLGYGALREDRFRFCVSDSGDSAAKSSAGPSTTPHAAATSRCIGRRSGTQQPGPPPTPPQSHILTERGSVSFFGVSLSMRLVCCSVLFFLFLFLSNPPYLVLTHTTCFMFTFWTKVEVVTCEYDWMMFMEYGLQAICTNMHAYEFC